MWLERVTLSKKNAKERVCANCGTEYTDHTDGKHAHITIKDHHSSDDQPPLHFVSKKYYLTLCPSCSAYLNNLINSGMLVPLADPEVVENEEGELVFANRKMLEKKLIDYCLPHNAFFHCHQYGSFVALIDGRHEKYEFNRVFKDQKRVNGFRHFDLSSKGGLYPGAILQIGGKRGDDKISRYIIVVTCDKNRLYYYMIDEERVRMVFPLEDTPERKTIDQLLLEMKEF